jgi:hypothetical protein
MKKRQSARWASFRPLVAKKEQRKSCNPQNVAVVGFFSRKEE